MGAYLAGAAPGPSAGGMRIVANWGKLKQLVQQWTFVAAVAYIFCCGACGSCLSVTVSLLMPLECYIMLRVSPCTFGSSVLSSIHYNTLNPTHPKEFSKCTAHW